MLAAPPCELASQAEARRSTREKRRQTLVRLSSSISKRNEISCRSIAVAIEQTAERIRQQKRPPGLPGTVLSNNQRGEARWKISDRAFTYRYLTATRDVRDGPFFMALMQAVLICFFFWIIHLVMRPSSGIASEQRRITSGVQADTCSSVYADAGAIITMIKSAAQKVRMEAPRLF